MKNTAKRNLSRLEASFAVILASLPDEDLVRLVVDVMPVKREQKDAITYKRFYPARSNAIFKISTLNND